MDQLIFTESGDFLLERVEHLDAKAPKYLHEAWRKAKQDRIKNFKGLQDMPYEKKIERQKDIAFEFFDEMQKTGRSCHVSVGGLDSITLYVWLLSIGIDVPAISVTSIEDVSIQRVHKALGITRVVPLKSKIQVLQEFGFPVISKKIAGRIDMLQHASPDNATVRHAIITGECGEQGHFAKNSRMQLPQKWLKLFGGWDPDEGQPYGHPDFKVSKDCCYWVKEKPCDDWAREHNSKPYLGLMAVEGGQREEALVEHGCNYYGKNAVRSCPFAIFLRDDVLRLAQEMDEWYRCHLDMFEKIFHEQPYGHYPDGRLREYKPVESIIPLIYGEIRQYEDGTRYTTKAQRTGCSMCGFGIHLEKRTHRFDRLRQTNPKEWEFLMYRCCVDEQTGERYGWGRVLDYIGVGWEDIPPVQMTIEDYLKEAADEE